MSIENGSHNKTPPMQEIVGQYGRETTNAGKATLLKTGEEYLQRFRVTLGQEVVLRADTGTNFKPETHFKVAGVAPENGWDPNKKNVIQDFNQTGPEVGNLALWVHDESDGKVFYLEPKHLAVLERR